VELFLGLMPLEWEGVRLLVCTKVKRAKNIRVIFFFTCSGMTDCLKDNMATTELPMNEILIEINCGLRFVILVKVKVVPLHAKQTQSEERGIALSILDAGARKLWVVRVTPWPIYLRDGHQAIIVQKDGWASGPIWVVPQNLALTGVSHPRPLSP
jgi:hypothetical protein